MTERLLHLFKGKRQRGERLPSPKEFSVHVALADLIERTIAPGWMFTHLPFGELRSKITGARLKRMGTKRGWPDFIFVGPHKLFFLELKRRGEIASDEQGNVALHIMRCGFGYLCTDDLEDAVGSLRDLGIVRARVSA